MYEPTGSPPSLPPRLKKSRERHLFPNPRQPCDRDSQSCLRCREYSCVCCSISKFASQLALTCQFFCRQVRSHLDNQVRNHPSAISAATPGHPHSHLRACSQVATKFAATFTIIFTAFCSKQNPSRGTG